MISFRCSFSFLFPVPFAFCVYPPHLSAGRDETISAACKQAKREKSYPPFAFGHKEKAETLLHRRRFRLFGRRQTTIKDYPGRSKLSP